MKINPINNQSFGAVKFYPQVKDWNPRILESVVESTAIKQAILDNESKGLDTLIYYMHRNPIGKALKINEFGVVKLKESRDNFRCRFETSNFNTGVEFVIKFIKTMDLQLNLSKKMDQFNNFISSIQKQS